MPSLNIKIKIITMKKSPKQLRANQTVDAIVQATAKLLEESDLKNISINEIAKNAGVAIGSIYDYFKNKDSILHTIIELHANSVLDNFRNILSNDIKNLDELSEILVNRFVRENYIKKRIFLRSVYYIIPARIKEKFVDIAIQSAEKLLSIHLQSKFNKEPDWANQKSFLLINSFFGVIDSYIIYSPDYLNDDKLLADMTKACKFILEVK